MREAASGEGLAGVQGSPPRDDSGPVIFPASDWVRFLAFGSLALLVGSLLLLVGPAVWLSGGGDGWFVLRAAGILVHGIAWVLLAAALPGVRSDSAVLGPAMTAALALSLAGFVVGWWGLPAAFPAYQGGMLCRYEYEYFQNPLCGGFFMYVPSVFAPAVVPQAAFFLLSVPLLKGRVASAAVVAGAFSLVFIAALALGVQLGGGFEGTAYLLSGLTAVGYVIVAAGFWAEERGFPAGDWTYLRAPDGVPVSRERP